MRDKLRTVDTALAQYPAYKARMSLQKKWATVLTLKYGAVVQSFSSEGKTDIKQRSLKIFPEYSIVFGRK